MDRTMCDEQVKRLRELPHLLFVQLHGHEDVVYQAANIIEELQRQLEQALHTPLPRWIPVTELLPEESEGLDWHEEILIRFTSVWCYDAKTGTIGVRRRFQGKLTGNEYLDQCTEDTDWHWSKSRWEPTHWMPTGPLSGPLKESKVDSGYSEWLSLQLQKHEPEPLCPFGPIECHVAYDMQYCWPCEEARAAYQKQQKEDNNACE